ncbi:hypothetical protein NQ487_19785 [Hungatella hathewayi]|uniref:Uncharacterized protein n=1 Tax=Hungatella hathewayi DSM 13479 TaxID=566550 RepID=D3ALQ0_9FIRM|nr:hypothetical protein [Hungatella hathewayi]EFC97248.1 hypothetical protein CLOSTHATH_04546 [Hungatella hathewayi DSM 13479]UWO83111.1 hypothetical protein NQ487_19785 [Hungatella hathewayi]
MDSYIIFQSPKAADDFYTACQLAPMNTEGITYISDETAAANLEMAMLYHEAYDTLFS